jgi:non-ribosomal peptide synthetase component F/acyl carrier protein
MVEHQGVCNLAEVERREFGIGEESRVLQFASLSFDASVWEIISALAAGGSLHVYGQESLMPGSGLERVLAEDQITLVTLPPTVLALLGQESLPCLQTVVAAGESCGAEIVERWGRGRRFFDAYGPTESTVCASMGECEAGGNRRPSIGRPIANTRLYILDGELKPAPVGVGGELYISGVGLARGYLGRAELTAERFIPDLYSREGGERFYRTEDVCRYLSDGKIEFLGRSDEQVKVRGYRIELGEIEAVLNECRTVKQSVVLAKDDGRGGKRLVGYVVGEGVETAAELKRHVRGRLPEHMVPEVIIALEEMPITANGKVDRKRLPRVESAGRPPGQEYAPPRNLVEEILAGIFEEVLKLDRVGINDNFSELGGHSLLATQIVSRAKGTFGVGIEVRSVFEETTVEGLAQRIEEAMRSGRRREAPPLVRAPRECQRNGQKDGRLQPSFAQERLWFADRLAPNDPFHNISATVSLVGRLDHGILVSVINEIVRRHEVLRTRFEAEEGAPVQVIDEWRRQTFEIEDLAGLTEEERSEKVRIIRRQEAETGFDLRRGSLLRVKVLKLEEEEHVMLFTIHHIVCDAWSLAVLVREMRDLYGAISQGNGQLLPELEIQYADYAYWQRGYLSDDVLEEQLQYWKKQLSGMSPVINLASDHPRPLVPSRRRAAKSIPLPPELYQSLKALSRQEGVTLFVALLAAFKTLLYKYTAESDIVIGIPMANRNRAEVEPLIGFLANALPMRTDLSGNPRFTQLLKRVKNVALESHVHREIPFEMLVEAIQSERESGQARLFNIAFGVQNAPEEEARPPGLKISLVAAEHDQASSELALWITKGAEAIGAEWVYSADLFEEGTIIRMHSHFETLLSSIVARPDAPLDELETLSEAERARQATDLAVREEQSYSRFKNVKPRVIALSDN